MMNTMNSKTIKMVYSVWIAIVVLMIVAGIFLIGSENMQNLRVEYVRDASVDVLAMLVGGVLLLGLHTEGNRDRRNRSMFRMILILVVLVFMDLLTSFAEGNPRFISAVIIINTLSFMAEDILAYTYWTYIRNELDLKSKYVKVADKVCLVALYINLILDLLNVKTGMLFTVSAAGEYVDAPYEFVGDIAIIVIFILAAIAIFRMSETGIRAKLILISFETFPVIAYVFGSYRQEYTFLYPSYLLSVLLIYIRVFSERGKKLAEQQVVLTQQSTALMISQIQPHFLYNVLTTISNLCVTDPEEAEETTVLFSQYLRTNLDSLRNQEPVPFATELGHIRTYVELEKKRFGDILNVEYDINEQNFKVPSLGLQPIVENSIKHGIRGKNAPGHIKIGTYKVPDGYQIIIEDDGIGFDMNMPAQDDGRSHVGMTNVKERLKQMCNATTTVESSPGNGCRTEIIIPESDIV